MKKMLAYCFVLLLSAAPAMAAYIVVMKDGQRYRAKAKPTTTGGKATIVLEKGGSLQLDPNLIDWKKSEEVSKLGMGDVKVIAQEQPAAPAPAPTTPSLGSSIRLRQPPTATTPAPATPTTATASPTPSGSLPSRVLENFERAFENVGIFEHKLTATGANSLRAELTTDNEERVFNAISATAFLISRNAGVDNVQIDVVELFMKTTTGGSAGRFHMSRADAEQLVNKTITQADYFVRKVIY